MSNVQRRTILKGLAVAPAAALILPAPAAQAAAPTLTLSRSTGGYWYETDTFYITRRWDSYYGQYTYRLTWGGNRDVRNGSRYYRHKLESVRIKWNGREQLITAFTSKATPETYWLNASKAQFNMTTRITNLSTGRVWYRSALIIF